MTDFQAGTADGTVCIFKGSEEFLHAAVMLAEGRPAIFLSGDGAIIPQRAPVLLKSVEHVHAASIAEKPALFINAEIIADEPAARSALPPDQAG